QGKLRQMISRKKPQRSLALMTGFEHYGKKTRRAIFLDEMEQVPWREVCGLGEPHYPNPGNGGPAGGGGADAADLFPAAVVQPVGLVSGGGAVRRGGDAARGGPRFGHEPAPDETTVCKFRHLLEEHELGEQILGTVNLHLQARGASPGND